MLEQHPRPDQPGRHPRGPSLPVTRAIQFSTTHYFWFPGMPGRGNYKKNADASIAHHEPPDTRPVRPVVWEDGEGDLASYPILYGSMSCATFSTGKGPLCGSRWRAIRPGNQLLVFQLLVRATLGLTSRPRLTNVGATRNRASRPASSQYRLRRNGRERLPAAGHPDSPATSARAADGCRRF